MKARCIGLLVLCLVSGGAVSVLAVEDRQPAAGTWTSGSGEPVRPEQVALAVNDSPRWGRLKGKVTFDGDPPEVRDAPIFKDREHCTCQEAKDRGDTKDQTWKIGANKGVADVVVWLRAPNGQPFKIPAKLRKRTDTVRLDQPYCAFVPHVLVLYPSYYDPAGGKQVRTGQDFEGLNSATIAHNIKISPSDETINTAQNLLLAAARQQGKGESKLRYRPYACSHRRFGGEQLLTFSCAIHPWMRAYAWVFDHPFAAVTAGGGPADKKFGTYTIQFVPLKVDLDVVYWHEGMDKPKVVKTVTFKTGKTLDVSFKIAR
jgi:hypothetical protein